jgi:hypothetical protein
VVFSCLEYKYPAIEVEASPRAYVAGKPSGKDQTPFLKGSQSHEADKRKRMPKIQSSDIFDRRPSIPLLHAAGILGRSLQRLNYGRRRRIGGD